MKGHQVAGQLELPWEVPYLTSALARLMTVPEAAAELGVSRQAVLQMAVKGKLPAWQIGPMWLVLRSAVAARKARA